MKTSVIFCLAVLFVVYHKGQSAPASRRLLQWPYRPYNQRQQQQQQRQQPYNPRNNPWNQPYPQQQNWWVDGDAYENQQEMQEEANERLENVREEQQEAQENAYENGQWHAYWRQQQRQQQQQQRQEGYNPPRVPYPQIARGVDPEEQMERQEEALENQQERMEDAWENGQPLRQVANNRQVAYNSQSREVFGPGQYNQPAGYATGGSTISSEVYSSIGGAGNALYRRNNYQAWNPNIWF